MTTLARREYKFLIDEPTVDRVRRLIDGYCEVDEHARARDGRYLCDTLYLDTLRHDLYQATMDNKGARYKVRIRGYPQAPEAPAFLEVKRRVEETIVKTRVPVRGDWARLVEDRSLDDVSRQHRAAAENFFAHYDHPRTGLVVPTVLVRYEREPFASLVDDYARVTFDRSIRFQLHPELSLEPHEHWTQIDDPFAMWPTQRSNVVLELKFHSATPPRWMRRIVAGLELRRLAFCKYTRAVETMLHHRFEPRVSRFDFG